MTSNTQRFEQIDALRGIAAVLVMLQHVLTVIINHPSASEAVRDMVELFNRDYFSPGRMGVVAFFLISGFVIPFSLRKDKSVRAFLLSRFFRIYPPYWVSLLLAIWLFPLIGHNTFSVKEILANMTMMQKVLGHPDAIPAYWTLFLELLFYALCLVLFLPQYLEQNRKLVTVIAVLMLFALAAATLRNLGRGMSIPIGSFVFLATMLMGLMVRNAVGAGESMLKGPQLLGLVLILGGVPFINWVAYAEHPGMDTWLSATTGLWAGYAIFFYFAFCVRGAGPVLLFLGSISYSLYLMQDIPLQVIKHWAYTFESWPMAALGIGLLVPTVTLVLAVLNFRCVEQPFSRFGKKVAEAADQQKVPGRFAGLRAIAAALQPTINRRQ